MVVQREQRARELVSGKRVLALSLVCASACGADSMPTRGGGNTPVEPLSGACTHRNLTQPCSCGAQSGSQACIDGAWSSCECSGNEGAAGSGAVGDAVKADPTTVVDVILGCQILE